MNNEMIAQAFKALSDPTRFHVVQCLAGTCCGGNALVAEDGGVQGPTAGEVCCHITGAERITSTVSHHLHELEEAGLIRMQRQGKSMLCSLERGKLEELGVALIALARGENDDTDSCEPSCCQ